MAVSPEGCGATNPSGAVAAMIGSPVSISASASTGKYFAGWTATPSANAKFSDPNDAIAAMTPCGDVTVTAKFSDSPVEFIGMTMAADPVECGEILPGGVSSVMAGSEQAIEATPAADYVFAGWTADPADAAVFADASSDLTTVVLTASVTITAMFKAGQPFSKVTFTQVYAEKVSSDAGTYAKWNWSANISAKGDFSAYTSDDSVIRVRVGDFDSADAFATIGDVKALQKSKKAKIKVDTVKGKGAITCSLYAGEGGTKIGALTLTWNATGLTGKVAIRVDESNLDGIASAPVDVDLAEGPAKGNVMLAVGMADGVSKSSLNACGMPYVGKVAAKPKMVDGEPTALYSYTIKGKK